MPSPINIDVIIEKLLKIASNFIHPRPRPPYQITRGKPFQILIRFLSSREEYIGSDIWYSILLRHPLSQSLLLPLFRMKTTLPVPEMPCLYYLIGRLSSWAPAVIRGGLGISLDDHLSTQKNWTIFHWCGAMVQKRLKEADKGEYKLPIRKARYGQEKRRFSLAICLKPAEGAAGIAWN